ncbi:GNAT family N-acetyltransferase [Streptomyces globisporus]|uniref:GNAT family N-acetyltransferase n=1 Tax=Streptomyces globisporus TaxID=1908 RepID=UPI00386AB2BD|nr:GNAT family N-acetyltransferase [Streptomyces globisporus]
MTETQAPVMTTASFDYHSDEHVAVLTSMFREYLLEDFDRTGHFAPGFPFALWLQTLLVSVDGHPVAFCSADLKRRSIELLYVRPDYRRRGVAQLLLRHLRDSCPSEMRLKAPVSPACLRIAERLGIPVAHQPEEERQEAERALAEMAAGVRRLCTHKRTGNPLRSCRVCYRALLKKAANRMVSESCLAMQQLGRG